LFGVKTITLNVFRIEKGKLHTKIKMTEQITKNQHYVPRLLLNHFGYDVKKIKRINIFDMTRGTVRYNL